MTSLPSDTDDSHRTKRRRIETATDTSTATTSTTVDDVIRWRSQSEQQTYSTKLLEALRRHNNNPSSSSSATSRRRSVRDAADKLLAVSARGRTRWSRAILSNRMKLRLRRHKKAKIKPRFPVPSLTVNHRSTGEKTEKVPEIDKRLKVLSRLVPGCWKLPLPNLLEETRDYIAALQMQVRAMSALAELLSSGSSSGPLNNLNTGSVHPT